MSIKFIKRNIKIYMQDKLGVFFSFLGVLISLIIYIFFLRNTLINSVGTYYNAKKLVDLWMMGSLISISAITTTLSAFNQKLNDYQKHLIWDFMVNESFSTYKIELLYIITSIIQSFISVTLFTIVVFIYLFNKYSGVVSIQKFIEIEISSLMLIIFSTMLFSLITNFIKSDSSFTSLSVIIGTLTGFLSGSYIPYGSLPKVVQNFMQGWVGYQNAACNRYLLVKDINIPKVIKKKLFQNLGISTSVNPFIKWLLISNVIIIILNIVCQLKMSFKNKK